MIHIGDRIVTQHRVGELKKVTMFTRVNMDAKEFIIALVVAKHTIT